ncbi:MAG: DUF3500 domain-containing protein [Opitutaceae bacterium]|nr:DUF3500 domain-containing protein [Verrucomicrobiales bacterium]
MNRNFSRRASLVFIAIALFSTITIRAHGPAGEMADAANNFWASLDKDQQAKAAFEFKADERQNWHFVPIERKGLPVKDLKPEQRPLAHALLASALSQRGLIKADTIMSMEKILFDLEGTNRRFPRDSELYFISVFGKPSTNSTWGWRWEGHHLAMNFTLVNGQEIAVTPSFMGTNPAEVKDGPRKGLRVLSVEEDLGRELIKSMTAEQKATAIFAKVALSDIVTGDKKKVQPLQPEGLLTSKMNAAQKSILKKLIEEYVRRYRPELASKDLTKIEQAGTDKISFAWAGGEEPGQGHYYRVQGPTFLIEYDNTQNNNNHIHAVWRDFNGDFGEDLLGKHYATTPHDK